MKRAFAALLAAAVLACSSRSEDPAPAKDADARPAPDVELFGARSVLAGPDHLPVRAFDRLRPPRFRVGGSSQLHTWSVRLTSGTRTATAATRVELRGDAELVTAVALDLGPDATSDDVHMELTELTAQGGRSSVFRVAWRTAPEDLAQLAPAVALRRSGRFEDALIALPRAEELTDPWARLWAAVERGRIHHRAGALELAIAAWKDAAHLATETGIPGEASERWRAIAHVERWRGNLSEARRAAGAADDISRGLGDPQAEFRSDYLRGYIASDLGARRDAERLLTRAVEGARALGLDEEWKTYAQVLALELEDQGRFDEALRWLEASEPDAAAAIANPDAYAHHQNNLGWVLLNAVRPGAATLDLARPRRAFEIARRGFAERGKVVNAAANLAFVALLERDYALAARWIAEAERTAGPDRGVVRWFIPLVRAELELAKGELGAAGRDARAVIAGARREAGGGDAEYAWRAEHVLGRTFAARGRKREAIAVLHGAVDEMERLARRASIGGSRRTYRLKRRVLVDDLVGLLLEAKRTAEAFELVDRARASAIADLDQSVVIDRLKGASAQAWTERVEAYQQARRKFEESRDACWVESGERALRCEKERDQLAREVTDRFDEAQALLDAERDTPAVEGTAAGERSISRAGERLTSRAGTLVHGDEVLLLVEQSGALWLSFLVTRTGIAHAVGRDPIAPWKSELSRAETVFVVPGTSTAAFDLPLNTELDSDGAPLAARAVISLLPYAGLLARSSTGAGGISLVVADPSGDLALARSEGEWLRAHDPHANLLLGRAATRSEVRRLWSHAGLFHFAGHGVFREASPWSAHLALAGDERITLEDVLIERPALDVVVLDGCSTGPRAASDAVGLPHAFLLAGARAVLATDRDVKDGEARRFMERFYLAGGADRPGTAFRDAVRASHRDSDETWSAFRLWGRVRR